MNDKTATVRMSYVALLLLLTFCTEPESTVKLTKTAVADHVAGVSHSVSRSDSCGTRRSRPHQTGQSANLSSLWIHFAEEMLVGSTLDASTKSMIQEKASAIDTISEFCSGPVLNIQTDATDGILCVHRFQPREAGIPPSALNPEPWVLLFQAAGAESVQWFAFGADVGSNASATELRVRRLSFVNDQNDLVWFEFEKVRSDFRAQRRKHDRTFTRIETRWSGNVVAVSQDSMSIDIHDLPVMMKRRDDFGETDTVQYRNQIDVRFSESGMVEVTPRTDSVTNEQRCWLGRHVIGSEPNEKDE